MKYLLILILSSPPHGYSMTAIEVSGNAECRAFGELWSKKMTIIANPESSWNRAIVRVASYECLELPHE